MMLRRTRNRAEAFAVALEASLVAGAAAPAVADPALASLVALAGRLSAVPQQPAPAFHAALRSTLVATTVPAAVAPAATATAPWFVGPAVQVAAGLTTLATLAGGIAVATDRAVPGDVFYGLRRHVENAQLSLAAGDLATGGQHLDQARARLADVEALLERPLDAAAVRRIRTALDQLTSQMTAAVADLLSAARAGSAAAVERLSRFVTEAQERVLALLANLPVDLLNEGAAALSLVTHAQVALATLPTVPDGTDGTHTGPRPTDTTVPTAVPTAGPTTVPTSVPTAVPSGAPTGLPTTVPTSPPVVPTVDPTLPSVEPTLPTVDPTLPTLPSATLPVPPIPGLPLPR